MNKHRQILNYISTIRDGHPMMVRIFSNGSCLNFHLILKKVYPEAIPYSNIDHIISKIDDRYYDITGEVKVKNSNEWYLFTDIYSKSGTIKSFKNQYRAYCDLTKNWDHYELISRQWLINIGFEPQNDIITQSLHYNFDRNRYISIGCVGEPNEMMFLCERERNGHTEIITLSNYDYDGLLRKYKVINMIKTIEGTF